MSLKSLHEYKNVDINNEYILREPEATNSDADCLMRTYSDSRVEKYIPDDLIPRDIEHAKEIIQYYQYSGYENKYYWSIAKKSDNKMIGLIGFCELNSYNSRAEIAYELDPEYWRQGIMTKVLKKVLPIMFNEIGVKRIQANVLPDNIPSIELLKKTGFIYEGLLNAYRFFKGKQRDVSMLGYSSEKYFSDMERKIINTTPIKFAHIPSHGQILRILKRNNA